MTMKVLIEKRALEEAAIAAIQSQRRQMAADEVVYEELLRAQNDPSMPASISAQLRDEYSARQTKLAEQQAILADTLDALGYVPTVPV